MRALKHQRRSPPSTTTGSRSARARSRPTIGEHDKTRLNPPVARAEKPRAQRARDRRRNITKKPRVAAVAEPHRVPMQLCVASGSVEKNSTAKVARDARVQSDNFSYFSTRMHELEDRIGVLDSKVHLAMDDAIPRPAHAGGSDSVFAARRTGCAARSAPRTIVERPAVRSSCAFSARRSVRSRARRAGKTRRPRRVRIPVCKD